MGRNVEHPDDLIGYIKKLERRIENLERSQRIGNTSIDEGNVTVNNGAIVAKHPNAVELFRTGTGEAVLPFEVDPTPGYVTRIRRGNGNLVFEVFTTEDGNEAKWRLCDRNGDEIVGDDWLIGRGLGRPWLEVSAVTMAEYLNPSIIVTSASYTGTHLITGNFQHPAIGVRVRIKADAATAGNVRVQDTFFGNTLCSSAIAPAADTVIDMSGNLPGLRGLGQDHTFELQVQRTSGAGNIRVLLMHVYGRSAPTL